MVNYCSDHLSILRKSLFIRHRKSIEISHSFGPAWVLCSCKIFSKPFFSLVFSCYFKIIWLASKLSAKLFPPPLLISCYYSLLLFRSLLSDFSLPNVWIILFKRGRGVYYLRSPFTFCYFPGVSSQEWADWYSQKKKIHCTSLVVGNLVPPMFNCWLLKNLCCFSREIHIFICFLGKFSHLCLKV